MSKRRKDFAVRFAFGSLISLIAALVSLKLQLFGGVFLAFPAIMPASLTLIERDAGRKEAEIDAEGAIIGALGLAAFALVAAAGIKPLGPIALLAAAIAWLLVSVAIYAGIMAWRARTGRGVQGPAPG